MKKIRVGHSPDPDDAFMFYALVKGKIPLEGFEIEHVIEDIERLNQRALRASGPTGRKARRDELEVTTLSSHAYAFVSDRYQLLPYGASVGDGYGPILVAPRNDPTTLKRWWDDGRVDIRRRRIAIPGRFTTACLVLQLYETEFVPVFTPFDQIFSALEEGKADFGLLIHEGQLTYRDWGFCKVLDLGEWWKTKYGLPLPLGMNAIRRDLGEATISGFTDLFRKSLEYALAHREDALEYALQFGRGLDVKRGDRFVGMYVNEYSLELGEKGRRALELLCDLGWKKGFLPDPVRLESCQTATFVKKAP